MPIVLSRILMLWFTVCQPRSRVLLLFLVLLPSRKPAYRVAPHLNPCGLIAQDESLGDLTTARMGYEVTCAEDGLIAQNLLRDAWTARATTLVSLVMRSRRSRRVLRGSSR